MRDLSVPRTVFRELIELAGLLQCREILSAWSGMKVARIAVRPLLLNQTIACLNQLDLVFHIQILRLQTSKFLCIRYIKSVAFENE